MSVKTNKKTSGFVQINDIYYVNMKYIELFTVPESKKADVTLKLKDGSRHIVPRDRYETIRHENYFPRSCFQFIKPYKFKSGTYGRENAKETKNDNQN